MIKLVMCLCRRSDKTREEFQEYWLNRHGPFFQENAATMRAKRYVQSHTLSSPLNDAFRESRGMLPEYDGVAEVWFESEQAFAARNVCPLEDVSNDDFVAIVRRPKYPADHVHGTDKNRHRGLQHRRADAAADDDQDPRHDDS